MTLDFAVTIAGATTMAPRKWRRDVLGTMLGICTSVPNQVEKAEVKG